VRSAWRGVGELGRPWGPCVAHETALPSQYGGTRTVTQGYTFSVDKQIGEGTYGQVFLGNAKDEDETRVALKMIKKDTETEASRSPRSVRSSSFPRCRTSTS
jgi:serine/threonine protein kinase